MEATIRSKTLVMGMSTGSRKSEQRASDLVHLREQKKDRCEKAKTTQLYCIFFK